jgi:aminoglycoside phosphotransferase (APT) family kinase protein
MEVESRVLDRVRACGVPTPEVLAFDASRATVPFAWQVLECIPQPDINQWHKQGTLDAVAAARTIGGYIARWQEIRPHGFGPFRVDVLRARGTLTGWHANYPDYYHARLADHLDFLTKGGFLTPSLAAAIRSEIDRHRALLELPAPCLVHKDLAFWNVLGSAREILAVIDWDDCVGGDPLDDLSLLGCFHDGPVLRAAFAGYAAVRPLPADYAPRFWLHLLRNMLLKAVIRLGSGYFELTGGFFLLGPGGTGADLKAATEARIRLALRGLTDSLNPTDL